MTLADGHLVRNASGHLIYNSAGHLSYACAVSCYVGSVCPAGIAASYTVSMPAIVVGGLCGTPDICTPSLSSLTFSQTSGCDWRPADSAPGPGESGFHQRYCIAGFKTYTEGEAERVSRIYTDIKDGCGVWIVELAFNFTGGKILIYYTKARAGAATVDIVGTYTLWKITDDSDVACTGATADASITVSP